MLWQYQFYSIGPDRSRGYHGSHRLHQHSLRQVSANYKLNQILDFYFSLDLKVLNSPCLCLP